MPDMVAYEDAGRKTVGKGTAGHVGDDRPADDPKTRDNAVARWDKAIRTHPNGALGSAA
jgi:hypothetical protein